MSANQNVALGINTNLGYAEESTWGTRVPPNTFLNFTSESIALSRTYTPMKLLGYTAEQAYVKGKRSVSGAIDIPVTYGKESATLVKHALGTVNTSVLTSGLSYSHLITGSNGVLPTGLSIYIDRDSSNIGTAYSYNGCQVNSAKFSQDTDSVLKCALTVSGKNETEVGFSGVSIATPQYINWEQPTFVLSASGTVASGVSIRSFNLDIKNAVNENRFGLGSNLKVGQGRNGMRTVDGNLTMEFRDKVHYEYFANNVELSGNIAWTSENVIPGTSTPYSMTIDIPRMLVTGKTPNASGETEIILDLPFTAYYDPNTGKDISITFVNANSSI